MRRCTHRAVAAGAALAAAVVTCPLMAQVTPTADSAVTPLRFSPTVPPPGFTPTFIQFNENAIKSLTSGGGTVGNPATDPAAYTPSGTIDAHDFFSTFEGTNATFSSWHGMASPAAPFDTQYGNALIFPLRLVSTTEKFRLSNLDNIVSSNDPDNAFGGESHLAAGRDYSFTRVGIDYGPDGIRGTADDIVYKNGEPGSNLINELDYSGVAVFQEVTDQGGTPQQNIDRSVALFLAQNPLTRISNTYLLTDDNGKSLVDVTKTVTVTPEPASLGFLAAAGALLLRRPRRARQA